ncbi:MAG TPA: GPR1/FUN34/YaaH family transporter [Conexibacter sp.]|nr:GPR1/FUN34/YaaH family transporter [Conexibacter sp.]
MAGANDPSRAVRSAQAVRREDPHALAELTRINLRPIGSPLPLGLLALVPAGVVLALLQLGALALDQTRTVALLLLGFVAPLMLGTAAVAFLARDTVAATALGLFGGTWLATALALLSGRPGMTSPALGVFLLCVAGGMVALVAGAAFGKLGPALVIVVGASRFAVAGLYELIGSRGLEHAGAILGLCLAATALYSAVATTVEDVQGSMKLPMLRRRQARDAIAGSFDAQLERIEHEAGVRQQL